MTVTVLLFASYAESLGASSMILELPEGARLVGGDPKTEAGQLKGRNDKRSTTWWANDESTGDLVKLEWVVEAVAGTQIGIEARHPRAGTVRSNITLE